MKENHDKLPREKSKEASLGILLAERKQLKQEVGALKAKIKLMQLDLDEQHGRVLRFRDEFEERTEWALSLNSEVEILRNQLMEAEEELTLWKTSNNNKINRALTKFFNPLLFIIRFFYPSPRVFDKEPLLVKKDIIRNTLSIKGKYRTPKTNIKRRLFIRIGKANWEAKLRPIEKNIGAYEFYIDAVVGNGWKLIKLCESSVSSQNINTLGVYLINIKRSIKNDNRKNNFKLLTSNFKLESDYLNLEKSLTPDVSIIIPIYNEIELTIQCLYSIAHNTKKVSYEVIIGDDGSIPSDLQRLIKIKNLDIIHNTGTRGFIGNCNSAANAARGKYLIFLNNDTQVTKNWLDPLLSTFKKDPSTGIVGSKLIYPDGSLQESGGILWEDGSGWNYGRSDDPNKPEYNYFRETDYVSGAALMIPTELFQTLGGFDPHYSPAYYEDTDLCFKARAAGRKVFVNPASVIIHHEGKSNGSSLDSGLKQYQVQNQQKFKERWVNELTSQHFPNGENLFHARGRTRNQKVIVVIDHYVPHFDQDAGSRSTWQYICLFLKMGYVVKFIGDNFYPHEPYTKQLQGIGVEVLYGDWYHKNINRWLTMESGNIDYIFTNRSHVTIKYLETFKKMPQTLVLYYGHDLGSLRNKRKYKLSKKVADLKASQREAKLEDAIWKVVDTVYYPSDVETQIVKKRMPNVRALTLPLNIYTPTQSNYAQSIDQRNDIIFVGGFGHPPNEEAVLWFINNCWPKIHTAIPNARFVCIGSKPTDLLLKNANQYIIMTGWVSDKELNEWYGKARIVAVPLLHGAGIKGKIVEAMLHGVPLVMTSVAAEGLQGVSACGAIADEADDFTQQLISCYHDSSKLRNMSHATFDYIDAHFSESKAIQKIQEGLHSSI